MLPRPQGCSYNIELDQVVPCHLDNYRDLMMRHHELLGDKVWASRCRQEHMEVIIIGSARRLPLIWGVVPRVGLLIGHGTSHG
eukprot:418306-Amphidinium_carterae.1